MEWHGHELDNMQMKFTNRPMCRIGRNGYRINEVVRLLSAVPRSRALRFEVWPCRRAHLSIQVKFDTEEQLTNLFAVPCQISR